MRYILILCPEIVPLALQGGAPSEDPEESVPAWGSRGAGGAAALLHGGTLSGRRPEGRGSSPWQSQEAAMEAAGHPSYGVELAHSDVKRAYWGPCASWLGFYY